MNQGHAHPALRAHVEAQLHQVRALDVRERVQQQIWTALEEITLEVGLDRRVANALWDAFFGRDVSAGYYRALADVSAGTATRDLTTAAATGMLKARDDDADADTLRVRSSSSPWRPSSASRWRDPPSRREDVSSQSSVSG